MAAPPPQEAKKPPREVGPFFVEEPPEETRFPGGPRRADPPRFSIGRGKFCFVDDAACRASLIATADVGVGVNVTRGADYSFAQFNFRGGLVLKPLTLTKDGGWHPWGLGLGAGWSRGTGNPRQHGRRHRDDPHARLARHPRQPAVAVAEAQRLPPRPRPRHRPLHRARQHEQYFGTHAGLSANWGGWGGLFLAATSSTRTPASCSASAATASPPPPPSASSCSACSREARSNASSHLSSRPCCSPSPAASPAGAAPPPVATRHQHPSRLRHPHPHPSPPVATPAPAPVATPPSRPAPAPAARTSPRSTPRPPPSRPPSPAPTVEKPGPPFYTDADMQALRTRYGLEADPPTGRAPAGVPLLDRRPDLRLRRRAQRHQRLRLPPAPGQRRHPNDVNRWNSARVQYDIWLSIPTMVETRGKYRYTRLSLGPKGGVIASDSKDIWGNVGLAGRYWFGRKAFAPSIEFTSALAFKVAGRNRLTDPQLRQRPRPARLHRRRRLRHRRLRSDRRRRPVRQPAQPVDEQDDSAAGMFFLGFRGNILWGAPAGAAVGTHAATTAAHVP
jgi:hypothetical protein